MTSMKEFQTKISEKFVNEMIKEIEKAIEQCKTGRYYSWVYAIIDGEFSLADRNEVAKRYIEEGGRYAAAHCTSSENKEKPGLTSFLLFTPESYEKWSNAFGSDYKNRHHIFFKEKQYKTNGEYMLEMPVEKLRKLYNSAMMPTPIKQDDSYDFEAYKKILNKLKIFI